ncbi:MAG: ribonuclease P [Nanoarchaeota archaeon]
MSKPQFNKEQQQKIGLERIRKLFQEAEAMFPENKNLANRYVEIARNISMKVKVRIPRELKRKFCKYCHAYLVSGVNSRTRTREGKVIISCLECKRFMRIPLR